MDLQLANMPGAIRLLHNYVRALPGARPVRYEDRTGVGWTKPINSMGCEYLEARHAVPKRRLGRCLVFASAHQQR